MLIFELIERGTAVFETVSELAKLNSFLLCVTIERALRNAKILSRRVGGELLKSRSYRRLV